MVSSVWRSKILGGKIVSRDSGAQRPLHRVSASRRDRNATWPAGRPQTGSQRETGALVWGAVRRMTANRVMQLGLDRDLLGHEKDTDTFYYGVLGCACLIDG